MNWSILKRLVLVCSALLLGACQSFVSVPPDLVPHVLVAGPTGNLRPLTPRTYAFVPAASVSSLTEVESTSEEAIKTVDRILEGINEQRTSSGEPMNRVVVFVHGGLNTHEKSIGRAKQHYQAAIDERVYPIFVNWSSGAISNYFDHLVGLRGGQRRPVWAPVTSPLYFVSDALTSLVSAPKVWTDLSDLALRNTATVYSNRLVKLSAPVDPGTQVRFDVSKTLSPSLRTRIVDTTWWWLTSPVKLVTAPFAAGFGRPTWATMNRRARDLLFRECEFADYEGRCLDSNDDQRKELMRMVYESGPKDTSAACSTEAKEPICSGVLSIFLKRLVAKRNACKESDDSPICRAEISLVGHSMGSVVLLEALDGFRHLNVDNVVFMGAAASTRLSLSTLVAYMSAEHNHETNFYNLSLAVAAENSERSAFGLLPSGSLLTWIDALYANPENELDRTFGRWENVRGVFRLVPPNLANRFHFRVFGYEDGHPVKHGEFSDKKFWQKSFWWPEGFRKNQ